jgi:hypothetical protein
VSMFTCEDLERLTAAEKVRLKKKAADLAAAGGGAAPAASGTKNGASEAVGSATKRRAAADADLVEIIGDESRGRGKAADSISIPYILWGHGQRTQLAGVEFLACRALVVACRHACTGQHLMFILQAAFGIIICHGMACQVSCQFVALSCRRVGGHVVAVVFYEAHRSLIVFAFLHSPGQVPCDTDWSRS